MKLIWKYLQKYKMECVVAPLFKLLEACFDLCVPLVIAAIVDKGIASGDTPYVWRMFGLLVLLAAVGLSCTLVAQYFAARAAVGSAAKLRHDLFAHLQTFSHEQTDKMGTATMITRMTSDTNQIQSGINLALRLLLRSPIIVFGAMIMAFFVKPSLAWIFAVIIPLLSVVVFTIILAGIPLYKKVQAKLDAVTGKTRETLKGVRVVRAFSMQEREVEEFSEVNRAQTALQNFTGRVTALMNPLTFILVNGGIVALVWFGAQQFGLPEGVTRGELIALVSYMSQILVELVKLANTIISITKAVACGSRIQAVMDVDAGMPRGEAAPDTLDGSSVKFENVTLTYQGAGAPSLQSISFTARPGMTVGIIGGTGSGKSSLVNLIPRFYDATEGHVFVDGKDVKCYDPVTLRDIVVTVPQKAVLVSGTVRSNLLWGNENATDEQLWAALDAAQAKEFVEQKPEGLDAPVTQNGSNFSGGQRQRLTIARALVAQSPVLILDDSASALDFATDAALRRALKSLPHSPTTFIVSQRTASIAHADLILVLEDGALGGQGTHDALLSSCAVYREIYDSQFKGGQGA
ncbi:MAG: ABC transporter ATP-binding protein [Clostridia bacterium]|nr:ABC transporter ATP-binding protein [Clostridia bacterium]